MAEGDGAIVGRVGAVEVDWPRTIGYYGGVSIAVAAGLVEAPLGLVIAAVPFVKMLNHGRLPVPSRWFGQLFEGATKPIGGDAEGTIRLVKATPARRTGRRGGAKRGQRTRRAGATRRTR